MKVVLYEKYFQERMAEVNSLAAQVVAHADPPKASELVNKFMDYMFPEIESVGSSKEKSLADKIKQLNEFSANDIMLEVGAGGLKLNMEKK